MRQIIALAAIALLALGAAGQGTDSPTPAAADSDAGSTVVVLHQGDWRLDAAHDCLKEMLTSEWEGGATDLEFVLDATGFSISKITVRGLKQNPDRIRFGFEFVNREQVKTLYWEADCRVDDQTETRLARRKP